LSTKCTKPKKAAGKVFALIAEEVEQPDNLIRGMCFISSTPLIVIIDTGATHSFITSCCVERLGLVVTPLLRGMDWMLTFGVIINCLTKSVTFSKLVEDVGGKFLTAEQVKKSLDGEASVFMMFALKESGEKGVGDLPAVQEFPEVFPDDIIDLPPEREVEFAIDLVPRTSPISIAPYRMSASELGDLKKQLEELLEKQFIRPSVSSWGAPILLVKKKDRSMRLCVDYR